MVENAYPYLASGKMTQATFQSLGPKGIIIKVIRFEYVKENRWNLGFGDFKRGQIETNKMTNNGDMAKVLATVAAATSAFLEEYPDRIVEIRPVDEKRKMLFNLVFSRRWEQIKEKAFVFGLKGNEREIYSPHQFYDSFEIATTFDL
jgi:hypothetical protein